jgi:hypothetical protein
MVLTLDEIVTSVKYSSESADATHPPTSGGGRR